MLTVYSHPRCTTCKRALDWLRENKIAFVEKDIRTTPPSLNELKSMLAHRDGELRRLFNTSGDSYRTLNLKEKLSSLSTEAALALLAADGMLVKRPFVLGPKTGLVGFDAAKWAAALL